MRKRKRLCGVLLIIAALVIMTLPVSEADAASSASEFVMEGSTLVKYRGKDTNVSIPDTVEAIGESAFEDNTNIELVVVPNSVKKIGAYAFWGCDHLDTVVLGRGLTEVGDYTFSGCKGLKQMSIPSTVTSIGIQAFGDCVNMTDITIPKETVNIHESAFSGCAKLTIHCEEGSVADTYAKDFYERQKEMPEYEDVPEYSENNGNGDGSNGNGGSDGSGNGSNGNGGSNDGNSGQGTAATPQPSVSYDENGNVLGSSYVVGNSAFVFMDASGLPVLQGQRTGGGGSTGAAQGEPEELTTDGFSAGRISKYTIVDGRIVADQAFYRNSSLQEAALPEGIEEIGQFSFARSSLTGIQLPEGVTDIAYGAFYHCDSLAEVTLPESLMNVEPKAFSHTKWVDGFLQDASAEDFLVSGGVLVAYRGDGAEVKIPDGVRVIAAEAFQGHEEITKLTFPDTLKVVGEAAFENCTGLREVTLNQGLESIKDRAFYGDSGAKLRVPASVKKLGLRALEGVTAEYEGYTPERSHEASAERLSNAAYRGISGESDTPGVTVDGSDGIRADLEGAVRQYELTVRETESDSSMKRAWERAVEEEWPEGMLLYEMKLSDESGIPLTKLGRQVLTVTIPLPEALKGQELKAVTLDRNGQLEAVAAKRVLSEGAEALSIRTTRPGMLGIYGTGQAGEEELQEITVSMQSAAALPGEGRGKVFYARILIGGAVLVTGGVLCLAGQGRTRKKEG